MKKRIENDKDLNLAWCSREVMTLKTYKPVVLDISNPTASKARSPLNYGAVFERFIVASRISRCLAICLTHATA